VRGRVPAALCPNSTIISRTASVLAVALRAVWRPMAQPVQPYKFLWMKNADSSFFFLRKLILPRSWPCRC